MRILGSVWWVVLGTVAAAAALRDLDAVTGDLAYFLHASDRLFSGAWADTFADPDLQLGPLGLALLGGLDRTVPLVFTVELGAAFAVALVVGRLVRGRVERVWVVRLAAGLAAIALGLAHGAYVDGHPAQLFVPLLWLLAGLEAREGRAVRAGAIVGLSAGLELWGVLGAVVVLLGPGRRKAAAALAAEAAVVLALVLPFVLAGDFRMFEYRWEVAAETLPSLALPEGTAFSWPLRLLQGGAALAAGGGVALRLRPSLHAVWAAPLAAVVVRLLLDPVRYPWYWLALETLVLAGAACVFTDERVTTVLRRRAPTFTPR
jgi:hypothetical protein